jgi:esterase/lipase
MIAIVLVVLLLPVLYLFFKPLNAGGMAVTGHPAQTYAEALERIKGLDAPEAGRLGPVGGTLLLTHGKKTDKVIVLLHGYTKSPHEFLPLGQLLFAKGYNVLIPRLPHHGLADHMTTDQALLTAEEIAAFANEVVDCAHGLGDHITVAGLSAGGLTTAWAAQNRSEIEKAVIMSPAFGYKDVRTSLTRPAMNAYLTLPNSFKWWDEKLQERLKPDLYYPRWSTHALAQLLRLSFATQQRAAEHGPAAQSILVITNANDASVNNEMTARVVESWRRNASDKVNTFEFPASKGLDHDFIDPDMPNQQTQTTYPILIDLITRTNH